MGRKHAWEMDQLPGCGAGIEVLSQQALSGQGCQVPLLLVRLARKAVIPVAMVSDRPTRTPKRGRSSKTMAATMREIRSGC